MEYLILPIAQADRVPREWQSGRNVSGEAYEEAMLRLRMAYALSLIHI